MENRTIWGWMAEPTEKGQLIVLFLFRSLFIIYSVLSAANLRFKKQGREGGREGGWGGRLGGGCACVCVWERVQGDITMQITSLYGSLQNKAITDCTTFHPLI